MRELTNPKVLEYSWEELEAIKQDFAYLEEGQSPLLTHLLHEYPDYFVQSSLLDAMRNCVYVILIPQKDFFTMDL